MVDDDNADAHTFQCLCLRPRLTVPHDDRQSAAPIGLYHGDSDMPQDAPLLIFSILLHAPRRAEVGPLRAFSRHKPRHSSYLHFTFTAKNSATKACRGHTVAGPNSLYRIIYKPQYI